MGFTVFTEFEDKFSPEGSYVELIVYCIVCRTDRLLYCTIPDSVFCYAVPLITELHCYLRWEGWTHLFGRSLELAS